MQDSKQSKQGFVLIDFILIFVIISNVSAIPQKRTQTNGVKSCVKLKPIIGDYMKKKPMEARKSHKNFQNTTSTDDTLSRLASGSKFTWYTIRIIDYFRDIFDPFG